MLESCRSSESGPAQAGPNPKSPESTTCFARPLHGKDSYLAHVGIRDVSMWSETVTLAIPFSVIRYLYSDPALNTFSSVKSASETHLCIGSIPIRFFIQSGYEPTVFPVSHARQKLLVLLTKKTFRDKLAIKQKLALIGSSPLNNVIELGCRRLPMPTSWKVSLLGLLCLTPPSKWGDSTKPCSASSEAPH